LLDHSFTYIIAKVATIELSHIITEVTVAAGIEATTSFFDIDVVPVNWFDIKIIIVVTDKSFKLIRVIINN